MLLDTNVLIAAFVSRGHCHELLEHAVRNHELLTSEFILGEFREKLTGKFRMPGPLAESAVALQRSRMQVVEPESLSAPVSRDPDDDHVLAAAVTAHADCLVTGDADLLVLESHQGIPILAPAAFWAFEAEFLSRA